MQLAGQFLTEALHAWILLSKSEGKRVARVARRGSRRVRP